MLILVAIAAIGVYYFSIWAEKENIEQLKKSVLVSVAYDTQSCSTEYPLAVNFRNQGKKTVSSIRWKFEAYRPGYSTNIADYQLRKTESDKILKPGESIGFCYQSPQLKRVAKPVDLIWKIAEKEVSFIKD